MLKSVRIEGGIETFVARTFLDEPRAAGYEHVAYCLRGGHHAASEAGMHAAPFYWPRLPDAAGKLLYTPWALWRARWRDSVSIVHFHGFGASIWAPLAKMLGLGVVAHSHGVEWERARWRGPQRSFLHAIARITCAWADRTLVVSRKEAEVYGRLFRVPCRVVAGGFEAHAPATDRAADRDRTILVAGRAVPEKRILETVEAWNLIADHGGYRLRVYCGGNYAGGYLDRVKVACAGRHDVELLPFVERAAFVAQLGRSSYFVAVSSLEGRSLAMLEALATGNVLVVAETPENREFIPGEGNQFVKAEASVTDIADALRRILAAPPPDHRVRAINVSAGRSRSWTDVRRDCEEVYASLQAGDLRTRCEPS
jgi:glycosyltransferase involved in cell wall biosynthesis